VLRKILKNLAAEIGDASKQEGIEDAGFRVVVDSAPFRDKVWALKAGIGWIAKHTNLITKSHGSWVFIGALLTTLDLDESGQSGGHQDHCGSCTKCIEACPTGAIVKPYQLDSTACISYLTIEHNGKIPLRYAEHLDGWLYGCDVCQDVCPWNRFQQPTEIADFEPRSGLLVPDLRVLSSMSQEEYDKLTEGTALRRAGRENLRRNALANMGLI